MRNLIKALFVFILLSGTGLTAWGQTEDNEPDKESKKKEVKVPWHKKLYFGGGIGASFSGTYTYLEASPLAGYRITDRWSAGLGTTIQYLNNKIYNSSSFIYGGRIFTRYYLFALPFGNIFAQGEYEQLWVDYDYYPPLSNAYKYNVPGLLAGGGLASSMGGNSSFYLMILYNFIHSTEISRPTPYTNPVFRVGFNIGI